jgi:hypothetical protein
MTFGWNQPEEQMFERCCFYIVPDKSPAGMGFSMPTGAREFMNECPMPNIADK